MGTKLGRINACHGIKTDTELILWADNVMGTLSDSQEEKCNAIYLENAKPPRVFPSKNKALKAKQQEMNTKGYEREKVQKRFKECTNKHEGLPQPEFLKKVGTCIDKEFER